MQPWLGAPADTAIAAAINGTGATKTALIATYATTSSVAAKIDKTVAESTFSRPEANTVIYLGDSLTGNGWSSYNNSPPVFPVRAFAARGYWVWAQIRSGQRLKLKGHGGVGGDTINMMLARLQADMLDKKPSVVVVEAGRNDISAGDTAATLTTELFGMWEQILATGARVIATTITPRDADTGTTFFRVSESNKLIREKAQVTPGVTLADTASAVADRVTGLCKAGYFYDRLHPSAKGAAAMGRVVAEAIEKIAPPPDNMPCHVADATTLFNSNALMLFTGGTLGTGVTGTVAQSWKVALRNGTGTTTAVASKVTRTDDKPGDWQQVTITDLQGGSLQIEPVAAATIGTQLVTGDKVVASIEFQTDAGFNPAERFDLILEARDAGGITVAQVNALSLTTGEDHAADAYGRIVSGTFQMPALTLPASALTLVVYVQIRGTGNVGTIHVGRSYVRKDNGAAI